MEMDRRQFLQVSGLAGVATMLERRGIAPVSLASSAACVGFTVPLTIPFTVCPALPTLPARLVYYFPFFAKATDGN